MYPVFDVSAWPSHRIEPRGSKPGKEWLDDGSGGLWLFKPAAARNGRTVGDDWAERIGAQVAMLIGVPAARVELAHRDGTPGIVSANVAAGEGDAEGDAGSAPALVLGNEMLAGSDPNYPMAQHHAVPDYTVARVLGALDSLSVVADTGAPPGLSAAEVFAGYLVLDALIANTDRHHENWGVLRSRVGEGLPVLAPSFDHASSLGFQLSDEERSGRLTTHDAGYSIAGYARKGRSRHVPGRPLLVDIAAEALLRSERSHTE
ncbi:MAG: hypothetical protein M1522_00245 [Actinobacteria bacterium]|nr:hypothetical protein [Actinomycetota bacterium]